jgi:hypothetical protein
MFLKMVTILKVPRYKLISLQQAMLHEYSSDHSSQFLQRVAVFCLELDVRYQQVITHGHPDLRQDGVLAGAEE